MSSIGNRFFVTALEDGTTLHGNLSVDGSLSQAYNKGSNSVQPDWSTTGSTASASQPTIMVTLLNGVNYIGTDSSSQNGYISEQKWFYNNNGTDSEIIFSESLTIYYTEGGEEVTGYLSTSPSSIAGKFLKTTKSISVPTTPSLSVTVPALRIVQNLASSTNVDVDTITFKGKYNTGGNGELDFQATAQIRISEISSGGYVGTITFANGISDITQRPQTITMTANLYGATGGTPSFETAWYMNGTLVQAKSNTNSLVAGSEYDSQFPNRPYVTDNAVIQCDFYVNNTIVYQEFVSIDDMTDDEYMYIQYANGANGNAASLRKGGTANFVIWIGKQDNSSVLTEWAYFQVKLLDGSGNVIYGSISGIGAADANGWRNLNVDGTTHKASCPITYDLVSDNGMNITGILRASTSSF